jgi:hypothetical protein
MTLVELMSVISSASLLVCAVSAANGKHAGLGGYVLVFVVALPLAASNLWVVHKVVRFLAGLTRLYSERQQDLIGKAFVPVYCTWAICTGVVGSWAAWVTLRLAAFK